MSQPPPACSILLSCSTPLPRNMERPRVLGQYEATGQYHLGRRVYRHTSQELYLAVRCLVGWYGYRGWAVRSELSGGDAYLRSGIAPTMCPADQRVTRNDWHWGYRNNKRDKWSDLPELVVKCSTHANHWNKCMELNLFNQQCMCLLNRMCLNCLNATFHNYLGRVSQQISSPD